MLLLSLLLQAVVERCGHKLPPVHTLVTLGGQHQGVSNTPGCSTDLKGVAATACSAMQVLLGRGAYAPWVRENLVQAQYFKVCLLSTRRGGGGAPQ
jgi:palmitoyl-protein thioesterase